MSPAPKWATRIGRRAQLTVCQRCQVLLLVGLDADVAALLARVDYLALTRVGEVLALAQGRLTYELALHGGRYEIDPRDERAITRAPAEPTVVLVEHRCTEPVPGNWRSTARVLPGRRRTEICDEPGF